MNIIFFGTPNYVIPILDMLHKHSRRPGEKSPVVAIVTQPPRPTGRKKEIEYSAVDTWAHKKNLKLNNQDLKIKIIHKPIDVLNVEADVGILASYGQILSNEVIKHFPHGIVNIHPSLLPRYRGASPVQAAIASGNTETGVTFMKMDEKMDHGPIISSFREEINDEDTLETLRDRLFERSAEVLKTLLPAYIAGKTKIREQDHDKATYTTLIKKDHGFVDWKYLKLAMKGETSNDTWEIPFIKDYTTNYSPITIHRFIRAMHPWPGAWTRIKLTSESVNQVNQEKRLKILKAHVETSNNLSIKSSVLCLDSVQIEGKTPILWKQFQKKSA